MVDERPQAVRILVAQLWGEARRRARWRELSSDEETAAVAELRSLAGGRPDLLAEVARILEATNEGELDEDLNLTAINEALEAWEERSESWSGLVQLDAWEILVPALLRQTPPTVRAAPASKIARNGFAPTSLRSSASPLRTCGRRGSIPASTRGNTATTSGSSPSCSEARGTPFPAPEAPAAPRGSQAADPTLLHPRTRRADMAGAAGATAGECGAGLRG
jgi:hypothetical protein